MGLSDRLYYVNLASATADDAVATLKRLLKGCNDFNKYIGTRMGCCIPTNVMTALKTATGRAGQASKITGYARDLIAINVLLNELDALPKPYPPKEAIKIFAQLMVYAAKYIHYIPNSDYISSALESFAKGLPQVVDNISNGGTGGYDGGDYGRDEFSKEYHNGGLLRKQ